MTETESKIVEAAITTFSRYGVRKTTMGDIAERAEVSRQTLYASFRNKDEILAASILMIGRDVMQTIEQGWSQSDDLSEKLDIYLEHAVMRIFDLMQTMPDSRDLISGIGEKTADVTCGLEEEKAKMLGNAFANHRDALSNPSIGAQELGLFFETASRGFKYAAADRASLQMLLTTLKASVVAS